MTQCLSGRDLTERRDFAIALARRVGKEAARFQREAGPEDMNIAAKGWQDFVTAADKETEAAIKAALASAFPQDDFLGEEGGGLIGANPIWVVDPIDGTNNYMRGLPDWGVSIALVQGEDTLIGAIYDATSGMIYHAIAGGGAFADDKPISASRLVDRQRALAIVGYSSRTPFAAYLGTLERLYHAGVEHRRHGAATLGLLRVASGGAELYYESHLNCWDALAGMVIAREAGAFVETTNFATFMRHGGSILAIAPNLVDALHPLFPEGRHSS